MRSLTRSNPRAQISDQQRCSFNFRLQKQNDWFDLSTRLTFSLIKAQRKFFSFLSYFLFIWLISQWKWCREKLENHQDQIRLGVIFILASKWKFDLEKKSGRYSSRSFSFHFRIEWKRRKEEKQTAKHEQSRFSILYKWVLIIRRRTFFPHG